MNYTNEIEMMRYTTDSGELMPVVSSRSIAEQFERTHTSILESIDNASKDIVEGISDGIYFIENKYKHEQNKQYYREVFLTRDGFTLAIMGLTGSKASTWKQKYIQQFNRLEREAMGINSDKLTPKINSTFLYQLAQDLESKEKLIDSQQSLLDDQTNYINEVEPKALFADSVSASDDLILIGDLAKILTQNGIPNMGQNRLFKWLRSNGYLLNAGSFYNTPSQYSMQLDLFRVQQRTVIDSYGCSKIQSTTKVTGKGQIFFVNKLLKLHELEKTALTKRV